ncbi:MAG: hypothetical protein HY454_03310 [Parcubacteria group bacterium]|nr:hypothetical protein [Parcubacteria group bacterium]
MKLSLGVVFVVSLASLGAIVVFINPFKTTLSSFILFSAMALLLVVSGLGWLGVWLRRKYINPQNFNRILAMAFREAALLAVLIQGYLWLGHFGLLRVWVAVPLLILVVGAEYWLLRRVYQ